MDHNELHPSIGRPLLTVCAAAVLVGVGACGVGQSPVTSPDRAPSSSSSTSTPVGSSAPGPSVPSASSSVVTTQAPVPVESNPPGDIPDNLAFVGYTNKAGGYSFTHPEGWARTGSGTHVVFTDKLNGVSVDSVKATAAPTTSNAKASDLPRLQGSVPAFELRNISHVSLPGGQGVRIVFRRNSDPDQVTGKVYRDEVEEYLLYRAGRLVRMDLYGPVGADNVDAYRTMSRSVAIR